jgi:hypothetical protein
LAESLNVLREPPPPPETLAVIVVTVPPPLGSVTIRCTSNELPPLADRPLELDSNVPWPFSWPSGPNSPVVVELLLPVELLDWVDEEPLDPFAPWVECLDVLAPKTF